MRFSIPEAVNPSTELLALRRLIEDIARQNSIELSDRSVIARVMDGDDSLRQSSGMDHHLFQDLSSMLRLFYRLEASSSEDLGISGLGRLWERQREFLKRFRIGRVSVATC